MKRIGMVVAMRKEILPLIENSGLEVSNESVGKYQISSFKYLDKEIINYGLKKIKELNEKYNVNLDSSLNNSFNRFHFLYRERMWNRGE